MGMIREEVKDKESKLVCKDRVREGLVMVVRGKGIGLE